MFSWCEVRLVGVCKFKISRAVVLSQMRVEQAILRNRVNSAVERHMILSHQVTLVPKMVGPHQAKFNLLPLILVKRIP